MYDKFDATWKGVPIKKLNLLSMSDKERGDLFDWVFSSHFEYYSYHYEHITITASFDLQHLRESFPQTWDDGIGEIEGRKGLLAWVSGSSEAAGRLVPDKLISIDIDDLVCNAEDIAAKLLSGHADAKEIERGSFYEQVQESIKSGKDMAKWFRMYADRLDQVIPRAEAHLATLKVVDPTPTSGGATT